MKKTVCTQQPIYCLLPTDVEGFDSLAELALDLRWSWNHYGDQLWKELSPELWDRTHNPWVILQTISPKRLKAQMRKATFRSKVNELLELKRRKSAEPVWFQQAYPESPLSCVAYFCMEFMLSEALPIYSGGLGNVAGDQLKAASDLGLPVIGVGLLYQRGYFRQIINQAGDQQMLFPYNDPSQLPITPLRDADGGWLRLEVNLPGYSVWLRAWQVQVGRTLLYLLDSNDAANIPVHRGITSELYGGGSELRLKQEILLGIGGWRLLEALNIKPDVCHLNEGHAAFAVLERARSFMAESGQSFETALNVTRAGNLFTTHTAVAAGFDQYPPTLIEHYLGRYAQEKLGLPLHNLLALGRRNPDDSGESFNMAYLAIRGSGSVNGVSRLHGKVSRHLFGPLFPQWPVKDVPVEYVTNGVHTPSWDSQAADNLWTNACGKGRWIGTTEDLAADIHCISDEQLWTLRTAASQALVKYTRERLSRQLISAGAAPLDIERAQNLLSTNVLTLGFARRFATYKRPNLLLHDPERLLHILNNSQRPMQLILAGKAHPADLPGQALIREWMNFIRRPDACSSVVFLEDYDMQLTEHLVQGVDVWLNTPRRPWEACGTSGMKVLVNGGINLSELDGWWAEAYTPEVGWAIGDGQEHGDDPAWDAAQAEVLYNLLEFEVAPEFYTRNDEGIPAAWVRRMRNSMAQLTPHFSANRAVREYTENHYLPAADAYHSRRAENGAVGKRISEWQQHLKKNWHTLQFGNVKISESGDQHIIDVEVHFHELDSHTVRVELYADKINDSGPERHEMKCIRQFDRTSGMALFRATLSNARPADDYTARVIPYYEGVSVPLENSQILWQR